MSPDDRDPDDVSAGEKSLQPCRTCGSAADGPRAFVKYQPDPNDAQEDTDWGEDLPTLYAVVCTECGDTVGVFDPRDQDDDAT